MAKSKLTYEEAVEKQNEASLAVKEAKKNLSEYLKENKLKRNEDYSEDKKHGKKITTLNKKIETTRGKLEKAKETAKELKPRKERQTKYDYPDGLTAEEKKKFRAKKRKEEKTSSKKSSSKNSSKKEKTSSKKSSSKKSSKKSKKSEDD